MRTNAAAIAQIELPISLTAKQCVQAIHGIHFDRYEWVVIDEFTPGIGYSQLSGRRIDVFAINCYPSNHCQTVAYEVKVSRQDFLNEIKRPDKRRVALSLSNLFYFVTPLGLVRESEIPVECGWKEVMPDLTIRHTKSAPHRDRLPSSWAMTAALLRHVMSRTPSQAPLPASELKE